MKNTTNIVEITTIRMKSICLLTCLLASYQLRIFPHEFTEKYLDKNHNIFQTTGFNHTMIGFKLTD